MSMSKVLPLATPAITSYPEHANLLSIIQNNDDAINWVYNQFILLYVSEKLKHGIYFFPHTNYNYCPYVEFEKMSKDWVIKKWGTLQKYICECIDMGYYITMQLNQFYISKSARYQNQRWTHPTLIYGYNLETDEYNIADFYNNGKYTLTVENMDCIDSAFQDSLDIARPDLPEFAFYRKMYQWSDDIILLKPFNSYRHVFKKELLLNQLSDYLNSENVFQKYNTGEYNCYINEKQVFGISVYNEAIKHFQELSGAPYIVNILYIPLDHKKLMLSRVEFLIKKKYILNSQEIYDSFLGISKMIESLMNLGFKYNVTMQKKYIEEIISGITTIIDKESIAIEKLIRKLVE